MDTLVRDSILTAEAKALSTVSDEGVNVVPVSVVEVVGEEIQLFDFFMKKTAENIIKNPGVALACWKGLCGVQIKAIARYETEGSLFSEAVASMKERFPERTLKGVIILKPERIFDISAGEMAGKEIV